MWITVRNQGTELPMTNLPYIPTEYSVKPGLRKLGEENHFIVDELHPLYMDEKHYARKEELGKYYIERDPTTASHFIASHEANHQYLMKTITFWLAETLAKEYKEISFFSEEEFYIFDNEFTGEIVYADEQLNVVNILKTPAYALQEIRYRYPQPEYTTLFDAIVSQLQEDVCVMQHDELVAAHVCLPSWWSPQEKMGMSMGEMHADVPGMDKTAYEHIWNACLHKGPYLRYNWTLTDTPILNQHPSKGIGKDFNKDEVFLRIERQVLKGFPEVQGVLFLIRTYVGDVKTLEKEQRSTLAQAIDNMSEAELEYKGLTDKKEDVILCINT